MVFPCAQIRWGKISSVPRKQTFQSGQQSLKINIALRLPSKYRKFSSTNDGKLKEAYFQREFQSKEFNQRMYHYNKFCMPYKKEVQPPDKQTLTKREK